MRGDIEGGVFYFCIVRRCLDSPEMSNLVRLSLLDRDFIAGFQRGVDSAERGSNIERYVMFLCQHRQRVGAYLVGGF